MKKPLNPKTKKSRSAYLVHFSPAEKRKLSKAARIDNKALDEFILSASLRVAHRRTHKLSHMS